MVPIPARVEDYYNLPGIAINNRDTRISFLNGNNPRLQILASNFSKNLVPALSPALFGEEKAKSSSIQAYPDLVVVLIRVRKPTFYHRMAGNAHRARIMTITHAVQLQRIGI